MNGRVVIVGGGLAGLAAASILAPRGLAVTLLEARPRLGGRASSFLDPTSGEWIDNCQHVTMRCCTNLDDFCRRVGIDSLLKREPVLYFQDEAGRVSSLSAARLPAPMHLAWSFLRLRFLSMPDKLRIAHGLVRLLREPSAPHGLSFREWLLAHRQTPRTISRYWELILTSALNETTDNIDYRYARQVFVIGFIANRESAVVEIPSVPLGEFYGRRLEEWLTDHGVEIRLNTAATKLQISDESVLAVEIRSGAPVAADHVILTVPFHRVRDLLPVSVAQLPEFAVLERMASSPITGVHLWFDRPVMENPHLVAVGRTVQWLFRRPWKGENSENQGQYIQAVISASRQLAGLGKEEVLKIIRNDVGQLLPESKTANLLHHRVVTERAATFSIAPGIDQLRPAQQTSIKRLWLAGDYTQTGWPATMEGAVRSGYLAAGAILKEVGNPDADLIRPPLKPSWLVRQLLVEK